MHHLLVYTGAKAASDVDTQVNALTDPAVTIQNNHFILPMQMKLLAALGVGTAMGSFRINSPHFRRVFLPYGVPVTVGTLPGDDATIVDYRRSPLLMPMLEEIEVDSTNTGVATPQHTIGLFVSDSDIAFPTGSEVYTMRATAAITGVANAFASGPMTFGQTLPQGTYGIVGCKVESATCIFARLIIPGSPWRPGFVGTLNSTQRQPWFGQKAPLGLMGQFLSTALPSLEIFCTAADTTQVVFLDLIKLS